MQGNTSSLRHQRDSVHNKVQWCVVIYQVTIKGSVSVTNNNTSESACFRGYNNIKLFVTGQTAQYHRNMKSAVRNP